MQNEIFHSIINNFKKKFKPIKKHLKIEKFLMNKN